MKRLFSYKNLTVTRNHAPRVINHILWIYWSTLSLWIELNQICCTVCLSNESTSSFEAKCYVYKNLRQKCLLSCQWVQMYTMTNALRVKLPRSLTSKMVTTIRHLVTQSNAHFMESERWIERSSSRWQMPWGSNYQGHSLLRWSLQ